MMNEDHGTNNKDTGAKPRRRIDPEHRKQEILKAAKTVFIEKGYRNCTMADLVKASGLSRGGFYHHYRDKSEVIIDLLLQGSTERELSMIRFREEHPELSEAEILFELYMMKLFDLQDHMKVYISFLEAVKDDSDLKATYEKLYVMAESEFIVFCKENRMERLLHSPPDFMTAFINMFYLGQDMLGIKDVLLREKEILRKIFYVMIGAEVVLPDELTRRQETSGEGERGPQEKQP